MLDGLLLYVGIQNMHFLQITTRHVNVVSIDANSVISHQISCCVSDGPHDQIVDIAHVEKADNVVQSQGFVHVQRPVAQD